MLTGLTLVHHNQKMSGPVNMHDAKTHFSKLVERVETGEEITIARAGKPVARLVPFHPPTIDRLAGAWQGEVWIAPDFDAADEDLARLFEGGE